MPAAMATARARAHDDETIAGLEVALANGSRRSRGPWHGSVPRTHLTSRLLERTNAPLVLIVAPAGFGKTTVLSEWADRDVRPFAWVAPDAGQGDVGSLIALIVRALDEIEPVHEDLTAALSSPEPDYTREVVPRLCRSIAHRKRPAVVVIDDGHAVHGGPAMDVLAALVDHLPVGSQLAIASRGEPRLAVGRLRAHRRVLELRAPDLAMGRNEAAELLARAGLQLEASQVDTLVERTEGWPAGLYLAALALREEPDRDEALAGWTGDDRLVAHYIRDELLSLAPRAELEFLVRTSVLDQLSGPLCDAVLERKGSAATLTALSRSNLLLVPLDRRDESYRYHPLLAGTLKSELRRLEPERERALNLRASQWHAEHDDPGRAIDHAIAAQDTKRAGELLWQNASRYAARGQNGTLQRWLERFTQDELAEVPALALVAATTHLTRGDGNQLRHWTSAAARGLSEGTRHEGSARLEAGLGVMLAATSDHGLHAMRADAGRAYALEPADGPLRAICRLFEGVAHHLIGEPDRARDALEEGASRGATVAPAIQTLCLAQLALLALDDDDLGHAEAATGRALAQVERFGLGDYPTEALVFAVSAVVRAARGRVEDATRDLRRSQRLLAGLCDFIPWYETEVRLALARAAFRLSDVPAGRALLAEATQFLRRVPDSPVLARWFEEARGQADSASATAVAGGWVLTTAELRVLHFLPSHL